MNEAIRAVAAHFLDGREVTEGLLNHIEVAIRAYDPCLSCATHALGQMPLEVDLVDADGALVEPARARADAMRLVVFGWGNESRGDDGLGPLLLARVAGSAVARRDDRSRIINCRSNMRSTSPTHDCALFIDAGKDTPAPFSFREIAPRRGMTHTTHALAPEAVLDVYAQIKGRAPPPAFALCLRGESFELGEGLSAQGAQRLEAAWTFVQELMRERSVAAWEKAARPFPPCGGRCHAKRDG